MPSGDLPRPGSRPAGRSSEAGYNLVVLAVIITVANIAVAAALPYWSGWAKRQKEEELIFRGLQYAEAIRIFRVRHGRLPAELEELLEVKPRAIRQLWPNPMAEDGRWGLLVQGGASSSGQGSVRPGGGRPSGAGGSTTGNAGRLTAASSGGATAVPPPNEDEGEGRVVGPILGVYSATPGTAMRIWNDEQDYENWHFSSELIQFQRDVDRPPPRLTSEWIGKPWPPGLFEEPVLEDGSAPGERNR